MCQCFLIMYAVYSWFEKSSRLLNWTSKLNCLSKISPRLALSLFHHILFPCHLPLSCVPVDFLRSKPQYFFYFDDVFFPTLNEIWQFEKSAQKSEYDLNFVFKAWYQEFCAKLSYTEDAHIYPRHKINSLILLLGVQLFVG